MQSVAPGYLPLLRHRRYWWLLLLAICVLFLLIRAVYIAGISERNWLNDGWMAMQEADFPRADNCFQHATRKAPDDVLPQIAISSLRTSMQQHQEVQLPRLLRLLGAIPSLGPLITAHSELQATRNRGALFVRLDQQRRQFHSIFFLEDRSAGLTYAEELFTSYWGKSPDDVESAILACSSLLSGDGVASWRRYQQLEKHAPGAFTDWSSPVREQHYAYLIAAASKVGQGGTARKLLSLWHPGAFDDDFADNIALGLSEALTCQSWGRGSLDFTADSLFPRDPPHWAIVVPDDENQPFLLDYGSKTPVRHWQHRAWQPVQVTKSPGSVPEVMPYTGNASGTTNELYLNCRAIESASYTPCPKYESPSGFLFKSREQRRLFRLGTHPAVLHDFSPLEIVALQNDLWMKQDIGYLRRTPDGTITDFVGRQAVRRGANIFSGGEKRPSSPFPLDPSWHLATDNQHRLWLVAADNAQPVLCARWTGDTFRAPTQEEQVWIRGGLFDVHQRLWATTELPTGFTRTGWRVAGRPTGHKATAMYAVDGSGRVWMICEGIGAVWQHGYWRSFVNVLTPLAPRFTSIAATTDGVIVTTSTNVYYLH